MFATKIHGMIKLRKHALYVEVSHPRAGMKVSSAYSSAYDFIWDKGTEMWIADTD